MIKRKGLMLVLSSPSGAGKTSIAKKVIESDKNIKMSISFTTRPKRKSERNGKDYFFVSEKEFFDLRKENFFVESANVFDHWYGTPIEFIEKSIKVGKDIIFDIDWQGSQKLSDFSKSDVVSIFILPPSNKILRDRLKKRNEDSDNIMEKRMSKAKNEIGHWIEYDYVLINDEIDKCTKEVMIILDAERKKRFRQNFIFDFVNKLIS